MKLKNKGFIYNIIVILLLLQTNVFPVKIVTWNLLKFSMNTAPDRLDEIRLILNEIDPDILIIQEMVDSTAVGMLLNQALNHSGKLYKKVPFFDGPDTDNAAFYKKRYLKLTSRKQLPTDLRDCMSLNDSDIPLSDDFAPSFYC